MSRYCLKSAGSSPASARKPALLRNKLCAAVLLALAGPAYALPEGGQVVAGDAAIAVSGDTMDIHQNSQRAILNFHSFDIANQQTVNFHQPGADAVALNRVLGDRLSEIHGALNANGQVYLINPNGVVFGNGAEINVGSLVVTTLDMTDQDFLAGRDAFSGGAVGRVENAGSIHAQDRVVLLAPEVVNRGDIQVPEGDIVLRSSRQALLHTAGSEIPILVDDPELVGQVTNEGSLRAGEIALVLDGSGRHEIYDAAINNSGLVRAVKGSGEGGEIHLLAATGVVNSGVLDASAEQGDGGTVSIISDSINQSGSIGATAAGEGKGGDIELLASHSIAMHSGSSIDASADRAGDSGDVVVIAEKSTWLTDDATIKARGGEVSGDGGFVEVSGFEFVSIEGDVNVGANNGEGGLWYIDPTDISIVPDGMGSDVGGGFAGTNPATWSPDSPPPNSAQINVVTLRNALNNEGNVLISTASTGSGAGNITFNAVLDYNGMGATRTLTLDANSQIIFTENGGIWDSNPATVETLNFTAIAGGGISIADGGATEGSGVINAGAGKIDITAETGDALITGLASSAAAADAIQVRAPAGSILNGGDKLWDAITFNAAGGVILEARGDIDDIALHVNVLDASSSHGDVRLYAGAEDVNVTNTVVVNRLTAAGFAGVHTPRILNVTNASVLIGDEIQLSSELLVSLPQDGLIAQGALTLIAPDIVAANPSDPVNPSRTLTLGATDLTIDTSAAGGNLIVNSTVDTVSVINRHTNSITVTDANAITLGTINPLMGAISISSGTGSDLTVGTDLDLSNKAGSLTLGAGRDLLLNASILDTDGSGITLTAPGNVIFAADSVVNTGTGNINVTATDGNVALGALTGGAITVTAGGSIADANGSGVNLTGTSAILTAGTGAPAQASIGTATDALETSLSSLRLNSTKGGAFVENNQSLTLTEAIVTGDLALSLTAGDLTLMESAPAVTGSATFLVEAGDLILQNAGLDLSGQTLTISADAIVNDDSDVVLFAQDADITLRDAAGSVTSNFETLVLNIVGGQGYSVENTGALTLQSLSTSQNVQISSDSLVVSDIHLAGSNIALEFNTPGNLTQTGQLTSTATADNVTLDFTAGSAITVDGNLRAANGEGLNHSFNFTAATGFEMGSDAQIGAWDGGIIINAQTGDVAVTGLSSTSVAEDAVQLTATTGEIRSANASARDINVENGGFIAHAQGPITDLHVESQFFQATAVTGDISIQEATSTSARHLQALGDAHITTGNDFSVADATVLNVANLNVDAGGDFVIADAGLDINGDLTVVADTVRNDNANISLRAVNADITLRDIGTQSRTWTTAFDQLVLAVAGTGDLTITDANALDLTSVSATGNLNITTSDGSLTVGTATLGGNTELTATDGDVVLTSAPAVTGNLSLITQGSGDVVLPNAGINIGGDLAVDADDLRNADGDTDLTLAATNANITLRDGSAAREWNTSFDELVLAITGTGDFILTNTDSLVLTSVNTGGNANISTNTGNLTVGAGAIDGNARFTSAGSLALASLTIAGDADFTAASGGISFDTGTIGGSAAFTSTDGNITLANAPTVGSDLSLTTVGAGDVILPDGGISIGGDLTVDADDLRNADGDTDLTLAATNANITLRDGSAAREWNTSFDELVLAITGTGDFILTNTDSLVLTSVNTGGNANISTNTGNLTVGAGAIDGNARFTSAGSLALASLTIAGDADFTAASGGISFDTGTIGGSAAFTSTDGNITLANAPTVGSDLSLTTVGAGDVILPDGGISIGGDLTVDAEDLRDADGDTDLTLAAANANITLRDGSAAREWNTSFDQLVLAITGTGDFTLTNTDSLVLTSVTTGGNANISTNTGNLTVGAGTIDGNASFTAGGSLALASLTIGGDADFTAANGGISFGAGTLGGNTAFTATNGDVVLTNAPTITGDLSLTTIGSGDVILADAGINIGGDLTVDADDLRDGDGDADLTLAATNANITLRNGGTQARTWATSFDQLVLDITGTGDFTLTNADALVLASVSTGGNASFTTATGDLTLSAGTIDGNAAFTAGGSLALASLTIGGDADFTAASGGISFDAGTIGGSAVFTAGDGDLMLTDSASVEGDLSLIAESGDVIVSDAGISIGGGLTVDADDLRDVDGDTDLTLAATNANITLRNGGTQARTWATSFDQLVLAITGTGDFTLTNTDALTLTSVTTGGNASFTTGTGNLTVSAGAIDGNASFTAGGSLALASLTIGGDADFTAANGGISFGAGTLGGNTAFTATNGDVVLTNAPTITGDLSLTTIGSGDVILADAGINIGGDLTVDADDLRDGDGDADLTLAATNANITLRNGGTQARTWATSFDQLVLDITGTGDFTLTNADALVLASVTTGGNASFTTATGDLTLSAGTIDANAAFTATNGDVVLTNAPAITGDLSLTTVGSGDVILPDAGITIGGDLTVDADDLRDVDGDTDLTLAATNANITLRNGGAQARTWATSFDQLVLEITGTGDFTLTNTDALTLTSVTTGGNASFTTATGDLTVSAGAIDGNASFTAGGNLALASLTIGGDADFAAENGGISFDAGTIGGSAVFTAGDGDLMLTDSASVEGDLSLIAESGDVIVSDAGISIGGDLTVDADDLRDADGDTDLTLAAANANITLRNGGAQARTWTTTFDELILDITGTGDFSLTNADALTLTSITTGGNASFTTGTGNLTVSAGAIDGNASFTAGGSLALASLTIGGDADFAAENGGISFGAGTIGGNTAFTATNGDVVLTNAPTITGDLSLTTIGSGDVILADAGINIGGDLIVDADDLRDSDANLTLTAANANIALRSGGAQARTWTTTFDELILAITGTGDFTLTNADALTLTSVATGGNASFTTGGDLMLIDTPLVGGDLTLATTGSADVVIPDAGLVHDGNLTIAAANLRDSDFELVLGAATADIRLRDGASAQAWATHFDNLILSIAGGGALTVADGDGLTLASVAVGGDASFSSTNADLVVVSEPVVEGALSLITEGSGDLILPATGLTHSGDLTLTADRIVDDDADIRLSAARLSATLRDQQQAVNWLTSTDHFALNLTGGGAFNLTNTGSLAVDNFVSDGLVNVVTDGDLQIGSLTGAADMAFSGANIALLQSNYNIAGELSLTAANQLHLTAAGLTVPEALRLRAAGLSAVGGGPVILAADTADLTLTGDQALALTTRLSQLGLTYSAETLSINNDRNLVLPRFDVPNLANLSLTVNGTLTVPATGLAASQRMNIDAVDLLDGDRSLTLSAPELAVRLSNAGGDHAWTVNADALDVLLRGQADLSVLAANGLRLEDLNGDAQSVSLENGSFSLTLSSGDLILAGNVSAADLSADGERAGMIDLLVEKGSVRTSGPVVVSSSNTLDQTAGTAGDAYGIRIRLSDTEATERSITLGDEGGGATLRAIGGDVLLDTRPEGTAAEATRTLVHTSSSAIEVYNSPGDAPTGQVLLNGELVSTQPWQTVRENRLLAIVTDVTAEDPGSILDELDDLDGSTDIVTDVDKSGPQAANQFEQVFGTCDELDQKNQHRCRVDAALKSFLSHWLVGGEMPPKSEIR